MSAGQLDAGIPVPVDPERSAELLQALNAYRPARKRLLEVLDLPLSNRDPLAEFSEHLVHGIWGGTLAESRVQAGHDLVVPDGRKVQVRYLANTSEAWTNEHLVHAIPGVDLYALVILEGFAVVGVVLFTLHHLAAVGQLLGKRHPHQSEELQFTARNWRTIRDHHLRFAVAGVNVWLPEQLPEHLG